MLAAFRAKLPKPNCATCRMHLVNERIRVRSSRNKSDRRTGASPTACGSRRHHSNARLIVRHAVQRVLAQGSVVNSEVFIASPRHLQRHRPSFAFFLSHNARATLILSRWPDRKTSERLHVQRCLYSAWRWLTTCCKGAHDAPSGADLPSIMCKKLTNASLAATHEFMRSADSISTRQV